MLDVKIDLYLNRLTGELFGSREKRKYDADTLKDKNFFQVLKVKRPFVFIREDENGDYEAKAIEIEDFSEASLKELREGKYSLSENHSPNSDVVRNYNVCQHCLNKLDDTSIVNQINLDTYFDYVILKKNELLYFQNKTCSTCGEKTKVIIYHKGRGLNDLTELNIQEVIVDDIFEVNESDKLFLEANVTEILAGKLYSIETMPNINNVSDHDAIKKLLKYKDFKRIEYVKFKKFNNFIKNKSIEKKYNVRKKYIV